MTYFVVRNLINQPSNLLNEYEVMTQTQINIHKDIELASEPFKSKKLAMNELLKLTNQDDYAKKGKVGKEK